MLKATKDLISEVNELQELAMKQLGPDIFEGMNGEQFELAKRIFGLLTKSENVMLKQAEAFERIEKKLDCLLEDKS